MQQSYFFWGFTKGKIVRLSLTHNGVPEVVPSSDRVWLSGDEGAQLPNGIAIIGNDLFFTNFDAGRITDIKAQVKRVAIQGDTHGPVKTMKKGINQYGAWVLIILVVFLTASLDRSTRDALKVQHFNPDVATSGLKKYLPPAA